MPKVSVIITTHNEGEEVARTVQSIRENTPNCEIIVIDEASADGSCENLEVEKVIRHDRRIGIGYSRNEGVDIATGDCYCFMDGHQRTEPDVLNYCAEIALTKQAIVWPDVRGLDDHGWTGHGARMCQKDGKKEGMFNGHWINRNPRREISRCTTMIVPGYLIPREVFPKLRWIDGLVGWGASEPAITVKAFFANVKILHVCGQLTRHMFRPGKHIPYSTPWYDVARNHALVARICFSDETWERYWLPHVFKRWLHGERLEEFYKPQIVSQCEAFREIKRRSDVAFWLWCIGTEPPEQLRRRRYARAC